MPTPNNQTVDQSASGATLVRYLEPATILTVVIGAVYYLGWLYIDFYLRRIGINHLSLDLPTSYYLKQGYLAVCAALGFLNLVAWYRAESPKSKSEALSVNLLVFIIVTGMLIPWLPAQLVFSIRFLSLQ